MGNYVVYVHQNKTNGKRYVGITNNTVKRWYGKGKHYEGCRHFFNAIQKYGWDNFTPRSSKEASRWKKRTSASGSTSRNTEPQKKRTATILQLVAIVHRQCSESITAKKQSEKCENPLSAE